MQLMRDICVMFINLCMTACINCTGIPLSFRDPDLASQTGRDIHKVIHTWHAPRNVEPNYALDTLPSGEGCRGVLDHSRGVPTCRDSETGGRLEDRPGVVRGAAWAHAECQRGSVRTDVAVGGPQLGPLFPPPLEDPAVLALLARARNITNQLVRSLGIRDAENAHANVAVALWIACENADSELNIPSYLYGAIWRSCMTTRRAEVKGISPIRSAKYVYADAESYDAILERLGSGMRNAPSDRRIARSDLSYDPTTAVENAIDAVTSLNKLHDRVLARIEQAEARKLRADALEERAGAISWLMPDFAQGLIDEANELESECGRLKKEATMMLEGIEALRFYFLADQSWKDTAASLGIGVKAVEKRVTWALGELRRMNAE